MGTSAPNQTNQAQRNSLNANFSNDPVSATGSCPMKGNIALFPVRYAIDEMPDNLNTNQGPHISVMPEKHIPLQTRSYVKRQIRDGWLYIYNATEKTLHEYTIKGHLFTRQLFREEIEVGSDTRQNPLESKPYIEYKANSKLYIAYSPVQWTWAQCEKFRTNYGQSKWITVVDLKDYATLSKIPPNQHINPLSDLGKWVVDVTSASSLAASLTIGTNNSTAKKPNGVGDFFTTTVATQERNLILGTMPEQLSVKPIITENQILGNCPDRNSAIMVSVNDPIGILDDLLYNLVACWTENAKFEKDNQRKIDTALQCLQLSGGKYFSEFIVQTHIQDDPEKLYPCIKDIYTYYRIAVIESLCNGDDSSIGNLVETSTERKETEFMQKWGFKLPTLTAEIKQQIEAYDQYVTQIRFHEMLDYLAEVGKQRKQISHHIQRRETDLKNWLSQLDNNIANIFMDATAVEHSKHLIERIAICYKYITQTDDGKNWISQELNSVDNPKTLVAGVFGGFNSELSMGVTRLAEQLVSSSGIQWDSSYKVNLVSRAGEVNTVLGLDAENFKHSIIYKNLSKPAQQVYDTLCSIAKGAAKNAWEMISCSVLPALNSKYMAQPKIISVITSVVLVPVEETSYVSHIARNANYASDFEKWWPSYTRMQNEIAQLKAVIQNPASLSKDVQAAKIRLKEVEHLLKRWLIQQPLSITSFVIERVTQIVMKKIPVYTDIITLGRSEALLQLEAKGRSLHQFAQRQKAWLNQKFGGTLPIIAAALNIWNLKNTIEKIERDGSLTASELKELVSTGAYTVNAIMALWVMPMWSKYSVPLVGMDKAIIASSINELRDAVLISGATVTEKEAYAIAKQLSRRVASFAAIGALAAGIEAWMAYDDYLKENDTLLKGLIIAKGVALGVMAITGLVQTVGVLFITKVSMAWVFGPVVGTILMVAGLAYLLFTSLIMLFKRNNLQKWMNFSYWGIKNPNKWPDTDEGFTEQLNTLNRILMEPVLLTYKTDTVHISPQGVPFYIMNGFWLGLRLPSDLGGLSIKLNPLLLDGGFAWADDTPQEINADQYQQLFAPNKGQWLQPPTGEAWTLPTEKPTRYNAQAILSDQEHDGYHYWQIWVDYKQGGTIFELQITYPKGMLTNTKGEPDQQEINYFFRVSTANTGAEPLEVKNDYFENTIDAQVLLPKYPEAKRIITLPVPE